MKPNKQQLQQVIANGNDEVDNVLILRCDSNFQLIQGAGAAAIENLNYVTRWETFDRFDDYVGENASKDDSHIDKIMSWANIAWEQYTQSGETQIVNLWS